MEWEKLIEVYPFLIELAKKLPGLRKEIENSKENPGLEMHLETIDGIKKLAEHIEFSSYLTAKLANPDLREDDVLAARKWTKDIIDTLH